MIPPELYEIVEDALRIIENKASRTDEVEVRLAARTGDAEAKAQVEQWNVEDGYMPLTFYAHDGTELKTVEAVAAASGVTPLDAARLMVEDDVLATDNPTLHMQAVRRLKDPPWGQTAAIMLLPEHPEEFTVPDGELPEQLHISMVLFTETDLYEMSREDFFAFVEDQMLWPITAEVNGQTIFYNDPSDDKFPYVLNVDSPFIEDFRAGLVHQLRERNMPLTRTHGFTPHMTVAYIAKDAPTPHYAREPKHVRFTHLRASYGGEERTYMIQGAQYEEKTIRRVKTPAGQRRFGQPIGSIITRDIIPAEGLFKGMKKVMVNVWRRGGDREQIEAIDGSWIRDEYLPRIFGSEDSWRNRKGREVYNPVLHGKKPKKPKGFNEGPPVWAVMEQDPELVRMFGPNTARWEHHGKTEPIQHVYRGMTAVEWGEAQQRGYIASDEHGTIFPGWEGTNAGTDPETALYYLPRNGESIIVRIDVRPEDGWFTSDADDYLRTRNHIPIEQVSAATNIFHMDEGVTTELSGTAFIAGTRERTKTPFKVPTKVKGRTLEEFLSGKPFQEYGRDQLSNPDTERTRAVSSMEFQRLSLEGGRLLRALRGESSPHVLHSWKIELGAWESLQEPWGGQTIDSHTGEVYTGKTGFALSVKRAGDKSVSFPIGGDQNDFQEAYELALERFEEQLRYQNHYLGVFRDEDTGQIEFDPIIIVQDIGQVERIGAYTHSLGGAYSFADGNGYWPPYVIPDLKVGHTGEAKVDKVIDEFLDEPLGDWINDDSTIREFASDPANAHGSCEEIAQQFVDFAKKKGLKANVAQVTLEEMGYTPQGEPHGDVLDNEGNIVPGFYQDHTIAEVYLPGRVWPYAIDFAATQYGYMELPKVST